MIDLSPEIIALAQRLASARGVSLEEAIKQAIEQSAREAGVADARRLDAPPEAVAARKAAIRQIIDEIAAMPVLDPRSLQEIMDELNDLAANITPASDAQSRERARAALFERLRSEAVVDAGPWTRDDLYEDTP
jgi:antitoxin VapB